MTFAYQPSAAGISWLTLCQTLDSRAIMEKELMKLSGTNSQVQIDMTKSTADSTLEDLTKQADGQAANAYFTMGAAAAGIATSVGTSIGSIMTMPTKPATGETTTSIGLTKNQSSENVSSELKNLNPPQGTAQIVAQNTTTATTETNTPSGNTNVAPADANQTLPPRSGWNVLWTEHGSSLSQSLNAGIKAGGDIALSNYTLAQAKAKQMEALAGGIKTVMDAQGQMLSSAISGCDNSMNNTESTITTIIQVSAVRG